MFAKNYAKSVNSSDLRDDVHHHATDPLVASALSDITGSGLGALLCRVRYADGSVSKLFESGTRNLAQLLRIWQMTVAEKGRSRGWMKTSTPWDIEAAHVLYRRVAQASLAHWMDGRCQECHGAAQTVDRRTCPCCKGSGKAEIDAGRFEKDRILDMVSELEGLVAAHCSRAEYALRCA
jgi:hypothetical protein